MVRDVYVDNNDLNQFDLYLVVFLRKKRSILENFLEKFLKVFQKYFRGVFQKVFKQIGEYFCFKVLVYIWGKVSFEKILFV